MYLKKILLILFFALSLKAEVINLSQGWQLVSSKNDINDVSVFNKGCINTVWKYSKSANWELLVNNNSSNSFESIKKLSSSDGYWVNTNYSCEINITKELIGDYYNYNFFAIYNNVPKIMLEQLINNFRNLGIVKQSQNKLSCKDLDFHGKPVLSIDSDLNVVESRFEESSSYFGGRGCLEASLETAVVYGDTSVIVYTLYN